MTTPGVQPGQAPIRSTVPARLDRLPWSPFHWRVVIALGVTGRGFLGYAVASILMVVAGVVEFSWRVNAVRRSLEEIATPLSARAATVGAESGLSGGLTSHVRRRPLAERVPGTRQPL